MNNRIITSLLVILLLSCSKNSVSNDIPKPVSSDITLIENNVLSCRDV